MLRLLENTIGALSEHVAPRRSGNQLLATICPSIIRVCIVHSRSQGLPEAIPAVSARVGSLFASYFEAGGTKAEVGEHRETPHRGGNQTHNLVE